MEQYEFQLTTDHIVTIKDYLDVHLKNKTPDCILYSQDGGEFKIHKEIFSQSNFDIWGRAYYATTLGLSHCDLYDQRRL